MRYEQFSAAVGRVEGDGEIVRTFARSVDGQGVTGQRRPHANLTPAWCCFHLIATISHEIDLWRACGSNRHRVSTTIDGQHLRRIQTTQQGVVNALSLSKREVSSGVIDSPANVVPARGVEPERAG